MNFLTLLAQLLLLHVLPFSDMHQFECCKKPYSCHCCLSLNLNRLSAQNNVSTTVPCEYSSTPSYCSSYHIRWSTDATLTPASPWPQAILWSVLCQFPLSRCYTWQTEGKWLLQFSWASTHWDCWLEGDEILGRAYSRVEGGGAHLGISIRGLSCTLLFVAFTIALKWSWSWVILYSNVIWMKHDFALVLCVLLLELCILHIVWNIWLHPAQWWYSKLPPYCKSMILH